MQLQVGDGSCATRAAPRIEGDGFHLLTLTDKEMDHFTKNSLQWFINEQLEEVFLVTPRLSSTML